MRGTAAPPIRVLIADDSATARGILRALIESEPGLEVCGEAADGAEAVRHVLALGPDLVTMDLQMPVMDGLEAIRRIMDQRATRILVVSAVADAASALRAVASGALDALAKPSLEDGEDFIRRLRMLAGVPVIRHLRSRRSASGLAAEGGPAGNAGAASPVQAQLPPLLAIAVSTGGPQALASLLPALPAEFPAAVLVAQHIADGFAAGMAEWLGELCAMPVGLARDGEPVRPGRIYIADSKAHLQVADGGLLQLQPRRDGEFYHPSCDRLLTSTARVGGERSIGLILTGLGKDGVAGIRAIAAAGGETIAQDEASSVVYGMNREAVANGCVQRVLPLERIAPELLAATHRRSRLRREPQPTCR